MNMSVMGVILTLVAGGQIILLRAWHHSLSIEEQVTPMSMFAHEQWDAFHCACCNEISSRRE
jgi:hypothetical protein